MSTLLALVLFFFSFQPKWQDKKKTPSWHRRWHFDVLLAYLGTATVMALFYFQFPIEWVVTSWAAVVIALLGAALLLDRPLFLHQGLFLTVAVLGRGMVHNLFGGSYFPGGDW